MRGFGILAIVLGVIVMLGAMVMDVSVPAGMGRVNNLGLMADRQNYTIIGGVLLIAGLLMAMLGRRYQSASVDAPSSGTRPCPLCAETIKLAAIKCKHCGAEVSADSHQSHDQQVSQPTYASQKEEGKPVVPASSLGFRLLCFALVCVIISAAVYHLAKPGQNPVRNPKQAAYEPKADELITLNPAAFGCMSLADFGRAQDHYSRAEYSAWAEIATGRYCFYRKDGDADIAWTVMQVRDDLIQVGIKQASEYSKDPELAKFNYWTLKRWASPTSSPETPGLSAESSGAKPAK
ncbi:hypothetical protein [Pseudomonas chlororaphis]|uniref:hypothetical protein n=1 Tax=Pseudomonas chlororaphis TaxID=587753 RepID=UPI0016815AE8|nr:hypothetical protein [Pseudomonas chlororaphis]